MNRDEKPNPSASRSSGESRWQPEAFAQPDASSRPRARDIGLAPGVLKPGPLNAITDVDGVLVGQVTIWEGEGVRTGVTAILPHGGNLFQEKVPGRHLPRKRVRKARRLYAGAGARLHRDSYRPHQHSLGLGERGCRRHPSPRSSGKRRGPLHQSGDRGDERRLSERHSRAARRRAPRARSSSQRARRAGRRRSRRRGHGDRRLRLEGRHRDLVASPSRSRSAATPWEFWCSRTTEAFFRWTAFRWESSSAGTT